MGTLGTIDVSFPMGMNEFNSSEVPTSGQFWRGLHYDISCACLRTIDGQWHRRL